MGKCSWKLKALCRYDYALIIFATDNIVHATVDLNPEVSLPEHFIAL